MTFKEKRSKTFFLSSLSIVRSKSFNCIRKHQVKLLGELINKNAKHQTKLLRRLQHLPRKVLQKSPNQDQEVVFAPSIQVSMNVLTLYFKILFYIFLILFIIFIVYINFINLLLFLIFHFSWFSHVHTFYTVSKYQ